MSDNGAVTPETSEATQCYRLSPSIHTNDVQQVGYGPANLGQDNPTIHISDIDHDSIGAHQMYTQEATDIQVNGDLEQDAILDGGDHEQHQEKQPPITTTERYAETHVVDKETMNEKPGSIVLVDNIHTAQCQPTPPSHTEQVSDHKTAHSKATMNKGTAQPEASTKTMDLPPMAEASVDHEDLRASTSFSGQSPQEQNEASQSSGPTKPLTPPQSPTTSCGLVHSLGDQPTFPDSMSAGPSNGTSIPPHLRVQSNETGSATAGTANGRHGQFHYLPPRATTPHPFHQFNRPRHPSQQFSSPVNPYHNNQEHHAHLTRLQQALTQEKEKAASIHKAVEAKVGERVESIAFAFHQETLSKLSELEQRKFSMRAKEIEIERLSQRAQLFETFLSDGQRFFVYELEKHDLAKASDMQLDHSYELGQADGYAKFKTHEAKLAAKLAMLNNREAGLDFKERFWQAQARDGLKEELKKELEEEIQERIHQGYQKGFSDGMVAGRKEGRQEAANEAKENGFVEGYAAARESFSIMATLQKGAKIQPTDITHLTDTDHPLNPFNIGRRLGKLEASGGTGQLHHHSEEPVDGDDDATSPVIDGHTNGTSNPKEVENLIDFC